MSYESTITEDIAYLDEWYNENEQCFILPYIEANFARASWEYQRQYMKDNLLFTKQIIDNYNMSNEEKIYELMNKVSHGKSKIILIVGSRGSGKTATVLYIAEQNYLNENHKKIYYVGDPENKEVYPKYFIFVRSLDELPNGSFAVVDEAAIKYNARKSRTKDNMELTEKMVILRHKDINLLMITQNLSLLEINADRLADIIIYKMGSDYGIRKKRQQNLTTLDKQNMLIISRLRPRNKEHCMIEYRSGASNIYRSIINPLPTFWHDNLISKSFKSFVHNIVVTVPEQKIKNKPIKLYSDSGIH